MKTFQTSSIFCYLLILASCSYASSMRPHINIDCDLIRKPSSAQLIKVKISGTINRNSWVRSDPLSSNWYGKMTVFYFVDDLVGSSIEDATLTSNPSYSNIANITQNQMHNILPEALTVRISGSLTRPGNLHFLSEVLWKPGNQCFFELMCDHFQIDSHYPKKIKNVPEENGFIYEYPLIDLDFTPDSFIVDTNNILQLPQWVSGKNFNNLKIEAVQRRTNTVVGLRIWEDLQKNLRLPEHIKQFDILRLHTPIGTCVSTKPDDGSISISDFSRSIPIIFQKSDNYISGYLIVYIKQYDFTRKRFIEFPMTIKEIENFNGGPMNIDLPILENVSTVKFKAILIREGFKDHEFEIAYDSAYVIPAERVVSTDTSDSSISLNTNANPIKPIGLVFSYENTGPPDTPGCKQNPGLSIVYVNDTCLQVYLNFFRPRRFDFLQENNLRIRIIRIGDVDSHFGSKDLKKYDTTRTFVYQHSDHKIISPILFTNEDLLTSLNRDLTDLGLIVYNEKGMVYNWNAENAKIPISDKIFFQITDLKNKFIFNQGQAIRKKNGSFEIAPFPQFVYIDVDLTLTDNTILLSQKEKVKFALNRKPLSFDLINGIFKFSNLIIPVFFNDKICKGSNNFLTIVYHGFKPENFDISGHLDCCDLLNKPSYKINLKSIPSKTVIVISANERSVGDYWIKAKVAVANVWRNFPEKVYVVFASQGNIILMKDLNSLRDYSASSTATDFYLDREIMSSSQFVVSKSSNLVSDQNKLVYIGKNFRSGPPKIPGVSIYVVSPDPPILPCECNWRQVKSEKELELTLVNILREK